MPHLEYTAAAWDRSNKDKIITGLEQVQNQAVRFIAGLKGTRGISEAMAKLGLPPLQQRRKQQRLQLLMRILSGEDTHPALIESYDGLMRHPDNFIQTRAQYHGHSTSMLTNSNVYYNQFLPKTVRELRESN